MSWRDLLQTTEEFACVPWLGGRTVRTLDRTFTVEGPLPREFGWYSFRVTGRSLRMVTRTEDPRTDELLRWKTSGYLVGDRLVPDGVRVETDPAQLIACSHRVHLIERGLDRFIRVSAGRAYEDGPFIYSSQEMPLGPEQSVLQAYLDQKTTVDDVPGVVPALDVAFRFESWQRAENERRRLEEQIRRQAEERERLRQEQLAKVREQMGTSEGRREMARVDFAEAARASLAVGGGEYLDHRESPNRGEMIVRFRLDQRRYECTCDAKTLRLIDAGICLTDSATGEKGDTLFTLESFPGVIRQAIVEDKLVVWRHA